MIAALTRQAVRDARIRTAAFAYLFGVYSVVQAAGYRRAYPKVSDRLGFATSFGGNKGLRLLYGQPHDLLTVGGYCAWRVGGVLAIAAGAFGVIAAVRALRAEEESGRTEIVLAGVVSRRAANAAALAAIGSGVVLLWAAEFAGFLAGGLPATGSAYLALATASVAPVFAGVGALASQLAPTRRGALGLAGATLAIAFLLRVLADTLGGAAWLRWATPLGWAELLRPFANPQPVVLLLPAVTTALLLAAATRLAAVRDIGTGVFTARDAADPRLRLLRAPTSHALRSMRGPLTAWVGAVAAFAFILGGVSHSLSTADVPSGAQRAIAKIGAGSITTPTGYLAFVFLFYAVAICALACTQIAAARQEETGQQLETMLAQPVGRPRWLLGRLVLAVGAIFAVSLTAGLFTWAGARAAGVHVGLPAMLEAGANAVPTALLFLGLAALAFAAVPRAGNGPGYGLLTVAFLWQLVGSLLAPPRWVLDLTPFAHIALLPVQHFRAVPAIVVGGLGVVAVVAAVTAFGRRDVAAG